MAGFLSTTQQQEQKGRPFTLNIAGIFLIVVGIFGLIDSYLILASVIIWGWLIVGGIGFFTIVSGIALMTDVNWAWSGATSLAIMNLFLGFIELIGAFNYHYIILGWVGIGQAVGAGTLILSAISLYLLYRKDARSYYDQFYYDQYYDPYRDPYRNW